MENSFWNISREGKFEKSFKKSFKLYVDSGMRMKVEADIDILRNGQGDSEFIATKGFKARFCKFIIDHYLCKIYYFHINLTHLTTFFA